MGVEHPIPLVLAIVTTIPLLPWLARLFFGSREEFAEDLGLTSSEGRWFLLMDYFGVNYRYGSGGLRGIWLNVMWFFAAWAAFTAGAYHLFTWVATWIA